MGRARTVTATQDVFRFLVNSTRYRAKGPLKVSLSRAEITGRELPLFSFAFIKTSFIRFTRNRNCFICVVLNTVSGRIYGPASSVYRRTLNGIVVGNARMDDL